MESCSAVERELDRVIAKFTDIREDSENVISDVTNLFDSLKDTLTDGMYRIL